MRKNVILVIIILLIPLFVVILSDKSNSFDKQMDLEEMKSADSVKDCIVLASSCHGKTHSINKKYKERFLQKMNFTNQICTAEYTAADAINYTSKLKNDMCILEAEVSDRCKESKQGWRCEKKKKIIENVYS